jgi:hypothetical protein
MRDEGIKQTGTTSLDLFVVRIGASARKFLIQVHRRHPKKNRDEDDCGDED